MSDAQQLLPRDHPMRAAWDQYKATDDYANSRRWALDQEADERRYVDGSLWAAFCAGWEASIAHEMRGSKMRTTVPAGAPEDNAA